MAKIPVGTAIGFGAGSITLIFGLLLDFPHKISEFIASNIVLSSGSDAIELVAGRYILNYWVSFSILILLCALMILAGFVYTLLSGEDRQQLQNKISASKDSLATAEKQLRAAHYALSDACASMDDICSNMHDKLSIDGLDGLQSTYNVAIDGSTHVTLRPTLSARGTTIHYWKFAITADDEYSKKARYPRDLSLKAKCNGKRHVQVFPITNNLTNKIFAVWVLPALKPGESETFEIEFSWPGFCRRLIETGRDIFAWSYILQGMSSDPSRLIGYDFEFCFAKELGAVKCTDLLCPEEDNISSENKGMYYVLKYSRQTPIGANVCNLSLNWKTLKRERQSLRCRHQV